MSGAPFTPDQLAVLCAVLAAEAADPDGIPDTIDVANALGRERPDLLNTKRERLLTQLRRAGAIEVVRFGKRAGWRTTVDARLLLASLPPAA